MASGTTVVHDVMAQFKTDFGAIPYQATLGHPILFDLTSNATGTGTGSPSVTLGFMVGPATLDAADLDPSADANKFWWIRKFPLAIADGHPLYLEGLEEVLRVRTRRTLKVLGDTLWIAALPSYSGFTASTMNITVNLQVGILYA